MISERLSPLQQRYSKRYPHRVATCLVLWVLDAMGAALAGAGLLRSRPLPRAGAPAILVIRNDQIGDAIMATAVIDPLLRKYPGARLAMMVHASSAPLLRADQRLAQIIPVRTPWFTTPRPSVLESVRETLRAMAQVRRGRFDLVVDLRGDIRNVILFGRLCSRAAIIGYADVTAGDGWVDHPVAYQAVGEIEANLRLLAAAGIDCDGAATRLHWSRESEEAVDRMLGGAGAGGRMIIGIHPGASAQYKRWPVERFAEVARAVEREYDAQIVIDGSDDERPLADAMMRLLQRPLFIPGRLEQLPPLINRMRLLISNDTSAVHVAAAVGTKAIVLWGPNDLGKFGRLYPGVTVIGHVEPCNPCPNQECTRPVEWCMGKITADEVLAAVRTALRGER